MTSIENQEFRLNLSVWMLCSCITFFGLSYAYGIQCSAIFSRSRLLDPIHGTKSYEIRDSKRLFSLAIVNKIIEAAIRHDPTERRVINFDEVTDTGNLINHSGGRTFPRFFGKDVTAAIKEHIESTLLDLSSSLPTLAKRISWLAEIKYTEPGEEVAERSALWHYDSEGVVVEVTTLQGPGLMVEKNPGRIRVQLGEIPGQFEQVQEGQTVRMITLDTVQSSGRTDWFPAWHRSPSRDQILKDGRTRIILTVRYRFN